MAMPMFQSIFIVVLLAFIGHAKAKEAFFNEVPKELRCSGCELTVKVIDRMMRNPHKSLGKHVDEVMDRVCEEKRFDISEYKASTVLKVCKFIKEYHGNDLHAEVMKHYAHPTRSTYFEFSQHLCIDILKMCAAVSHKGGHENETFMHFDSKTHDFKLKDGTKVRTPQPVRDTSHDEL